MRSCGPKPPSRFKIANLNPRTSLENFTTLKFYYSKSVKYSKPKPEHEPKPTPKSNPKSNPKPHPKPHPTVKARDEEITELGPMREQAQRARYLESQLKLARSENTTLKVSGVGFGYC